MTQHTLTSCHSTEWIEFRVQMEDDVLRFRFTEHDQVEVGDGAIVTSLDKDVFTGEVVEVDTDTGLFHVSLS